MIYVFLAQGFEETEALATVDVLRRAKLEVKTVGIGSKTVTGSHGITVVADAGENDILLDKQLMAVVLPGGMPGTINLEKSQTVAKALDYAYENGRFVCAICAAPSILGKRGMLDGKKATCFPGFEVDSRNITYTGAPAQSDGKIITGKGAGCAVDFGLEIVKNILDGKTFEKVRGAMQCP